MRLPVEYVPPTNKVDWFAIGDGSVYLERPLYIGGFYDSDNIVLI